MCILLALLLLASTTWAATTPSNRPTRGYQGRASGFDHNGDLTPDTTLCDGSDTAADEDVDGAGAARDDQCYVDCTSGSNTTSCGSPSSPCLTLEYCDSDSNTAANARWRMGAPSATQIQAICFKGTCNNAQLSLAQSGASGTWPKTASGSEPRDWQYPRYPYIISGWDNDGDNSYPPYDTDDTSVVDGNGSGNTNTFFNSGGNSRYEIAHFTIRDYGRACGSGSDVGVGYPGGGGDVTHVWWHDLKVIDVNRGCDQGDPAQESGHILWNNFTGGGNQLDYAAFINIDIQNWGGYILRGSSPSDLVPAEQSGPYRFQNVSATALPANSSPVFCFKPWSNVAGFDVLDGIYDANTAAYTPGDPSAHYCVTADQCVTDYVVRNNRFQNWKQGFISQPSASGGCSSIDVDDVVIDANEFLNSYTGWGNFGHTVIRMDANDGSSSQAAQDLTITNNVLQSSDSQLRALIWIVNSRSSGAITGALTITNNTMDAGGGSCNLGGIGLCTNAGCLTQRYQTINLYNNILTGCASGADVVSVAYAPSTFTADYNLYDSDALANWSWNGGSSSTLAAWRTASGDDANAKNTCSASFVSSSDYHLGASDTCAMNAGMDAGVDADYDGQAATGARDIGADEYYACHGGR